MDTNLNHPGQGLSALDASQEDFDLSVLAPLLKKWWLLVICAVLAGLAGLGIAALVPPTFTAMTTFIPPQQAQSSAAASALSSLGPLAGMALGGAGLRTPADQYVALMQSVQVADRLVDKFKLMDVYEESLRTDARRKLARSVRFALGKKDGLITIEVDDRSPERAAQLANQYVDELRKLIASLAVTEAQQRRVFFEKQMLATKDKLVSAQMALQASGFNQGALRAEPKAAAEGFARLKAELTAAEVKLQVLRGSLADTTPEVRRQQAAVAALKAQLGREEQPAAEGPQTQGYITSYREFKYQETLFEMYSRHFELARVDESREGALLQVVDEARPPERKSAPKRSIFVAIGALVGLILSALWVALRR